MSKDLNIDSKFIFSGYETLNNSLALYRITTEDLNNINILDEKKFVSPSFVIYSNDKIFTFEKFNNNIRLYLLKVINDKIKIIDSYVIHGSSITHLVYSEKNDILFGCSYNDGTFFAIKIVKNRFSSLLQFEKQSLENKISRCHCVFLNEEEDILGVVNISLDRIYLYSINNDHLDLISFINFPLGTGPRHAIYYNKKIYCVSEYSNELFIINEENNIIKKVSTLTDEFKGVSYGATLCISLGKIFCSNRGEDSIAIFNENGEYIKSLSCYGNHPRHMIISNDQKLIISCNKNSNNISFIDIKTGELIYNIAFQSPSGVCEIISR